jgi:hypothetical protein
VLFAIDETYDDSGKLQRVRLVPATRQQQYKTAGLTNEPPPAPPMPTDVRRRYTLTWADKRWSGKVVFTSDLHGATPTKLERVSAEGNEPVSLDRVLKCEPGASPPSELFLELAPKEHGQYLLTLSIAYPRGAATPDKRDETLTLTLPEHP